MLSSDTLNSLLHLYVMSGNIIQPHWSLLKYVHVKRDRMFFCLNILLYLFILGFQPQYGFSVLVSLVVKKTTICLLITTHCCLTCCQEHMLPLGTRHEPAMKRATPSLLPSCRGGSAPADTRDAPRKFTRHAPLHRQQTPPVSPFTTSLLEIFSWWRCWYFSVLSATDHSTQDVLKMHWSLWRATFYGQEKSSAVQCTRNFICAQSMVHWRRCCKVLLMKISTLFKILPCTVSVTCTGTSQSHVHT